MREMAAVREKANLIVSVGVEVKNAACHVLDMARRYKSISQMFCICGCYIDLLVGPQIKNWSPVW